jgi:OOP family OmpA-OmpF porin
MTSHRNKTLLALAALSCLGSAPALAQDSSNYYYLGGTVGQTRAKIDEEGITARLMGPGVLGTVVTRDDSDTGYRLFLGRQFNRYIAVEAGVFKLGRYSFHSTSFPPGTLDGQLRSQGANLDLVAGMPLSDKLTAIARVGAQYAKTRDSFSGTGAVHVIDGSPNKSSTNAKVGLGLEYAVNSSFSVRAEAERYRMNDATGGNGHVNMYSVSLLFPFGRAPTSRRVAAAPAYVAPAYVAPAPVVMAPPAPAPVVVMAAPAPAPVQPRRVSFSAESLFGFDRAEMRPEGKTALDGFSRELAGSQFEQIRVEGHTDRLGTDAYNQKLSMERAEAVKAYLVNQGRLDGNKITAVGKSESMPVTKAEDCKGQRATPALIACLQPDRRVDVEVNATR